MRVLFGEWPMNTLSDRGSPYGTGSSLGTSIKSNEDESDGELSVPELKGGGVSEGQLGSVPSSQDPSIFVLTSALSDGSGESGASWLLAGSPLLEWVVFMTGAIKPYAFRVG